MTITPGRRCSALTRFGEDCWNSATTTENGKPYCHLHAPSFIKAKREERKAQVEADSKALCASRDSERLRSRQADLFPELLEACKMAEPVLDGASATWNEGGNTAINKARPAWEAVKAVIAKAEGH